MLGAEAAAVEEHRSHGQAGASGPMPASEKPPAPPQRLQPLGAPALAPDDDDEEADTSGYVVEWQLFHAEEERDGGQEHPERADQEELWKDSGVLPGLVN